MCENPLFNRYIYYIYYISIAEGIFTHHNRLSKEIVEQLPPETVPELNCIWYKTT